MIAVIDSALNDFDGLRGACDDIDYTGVVNPADGVLYPGISDDVPKSVAGEVLSIAEKASGRKLSTKTIFFRLTTEGEEIPHQAHNDRVMGDYGFILYMNRAEDCAGGTSFVFHKEEGMASGPSCERQEAVWRRDVNRYDAWRVYKMIDMEPNRAFVFDSFLMHRAEMPNNFGSGPKDGRLTLIAFFEAE